jgi:hypothetical protein
MAVECQQLAARGRKNLQLALQPQGRLRAFVRWPMRIPSSHAPNVPRQYEEGSSQDGRHRHVEVRFSRCPSRGNSENAIIAASFKSDRFNADEAWKRSGYGYGTYEKHYKRPADSLCVYELKQ